MSFLCFFVARVPAQTINELQRGFERPPDEAKIMMRWWWFGPAVTKAELEREMRLMKEGGIGGFEVQPVYPLLPDDPFLLMRDLGLATFATAGLWAVGIREMTRL